MIRTIVLLTAAGLAALIAVLVARTLTLDGGVREISFDPVTPLDQAAADAAAARLGELIRLPTISWGDDRPPDAAAFGALAPFLERAYPAAHAAMTREAVGYSLLYRWQGTGAEQKPIAFLAHTDVVPVEPGTETGWTHPAFDGVVADGLVWGRGAIDDKGSVIALMEAAERLAAAGFRPARDIYFLFGHDEEIGGPDGAQAMAAVLKERGVRFTWTLDEGSGLVDGVIPGVTNPVALIATAEKGYLNLRLTATAPGGHSSAPGEDTAVSLVSRAVVAVTDAPHPLEIDDNLVAFLHALAPSQPFAQRLALSNLWLTGPPIKARLAGDPTVAASMRTTTAPTMIDGGTKDNVLPQTATALVNYRLHPRDTVESVANRARALIDDERVTVETVLGIGASPQSSTTSDGYQAIAASVAAVFGPVPVAPSLVLGGTDTRAYVGLADDHYRFAPLIFRTEDLRLLHGTDERLAIDNLARAIIWYEDLIRRTAS